MEDVELLNNTGLEMTMEVAEDENMEDEDFYQN
jgi:hypothetical protein